MPQSPSFYQRLNMETFINAHSCGATMGGSIMAPAVMEAMVEASRSFMSLEQLHDQAGARIAELTGNEAAFVCAGAASGLVLGRGDLVEACRLNSSPHSAMGRGMKVGKEEIAGLLTAVERFMARDEGAVIAEWERRCRQIGAARRG
jgi:L-seryl-tRNA(Ser) seleniumtransferase